MAILKHFAVKNADYGAVIDYLKYQHDEFHLVPILDENGNSMLRDEFYFDGLNCNPEAFDLECELLNQQYHKNQRSAFYTETNQRRTHTLIEMPQTRMYKLFCGIFLCKEKRGGSN